MFGSDALMHADHGGYITPLKVQQQGLPANEGGTCLP